MPVQRCTPGSDAVIELGDIHAGYQASVPVARASLVQDRLALARTLSRQGHPARAYAIGLELHEAALAASDEAALAEIADLLAHCSIFMGRYEQGVPFARSALARWHARDDVTRQAGAHANLAMLLSITGDPEGLAEAGSALELAEAAGDVTALIWALQANCQVLLLLKQPDQGIPFGERAVALGRQSGEPCLSAMINLAEAIVCAARADADADPARLHHAVGRAVALMREGVAIARARGDGRGERHVLSNTAEYSLYAGDTGTALAALAAYEDAQGEATELCEAHYLLLRGRTLAALGQPDAALRMLEACRDLCRTHDFVEVGIMAHLDVCDLHAQRGAFEQALEAHRAYHALSVRLASDAAQRRARVYAVQRETQELRAQATAARARALDLTASNTMLALEAERHLRTSLEDSLTGLANRRRLDAAFAALAPDVTPFALAMIDVDHFKDVNDRFSHAVGDAVLRRLAGLLTEGSRRGDLVARYGGEEFALLMERTDAETARAACERLRADVAAHDWHALQPGLRVTVSIGVASSGEAAPAALPALADSRMYRAKHAGRDRVAWG